MYVYVLQITPVSCSTELDSSASAFNLLWFHMCWWGKLDLWKVGLSVDGKCFNFVKFLWKVLGWSSGFPSEYLESHCCSEQQQQKKKWLELVAVFEALRVKSSCCHWYCCGVTLAFFLPLLDTCFYLHSLVAWSVVRQHASIKVT